MKFHLISLGCSKNTADSEAIANHFRAHGWQWTNHPVKADLLLINTCGFINDAKEESLQVIIQALALKSDNPGMKTAVFGCLVKRYRDEIKQNISEIDYLYGFLTEDELNFLAQSSFQMPGNKKVSPDYNESWRFFTPPHTGILKIAEGCSNNCTYCAIPGIRGPFISRDPEKILVDARRLASSGAVELSVVAQDITRYGTDIGGKCLLPELVRKLAKIESIKWIRLHYMHPRGLTPELIDQLYGIEKVVPYFDIPFQHASERLLQAMNRGTAKSHLIELIQHIRKNYPAAAIRTTFIVGFPGEKKADFDELIAFIEEHPLDRVGAFAYSPEESTPAALMRPRVGATVKQARLDQLMTLQQLIIEELNQKFIGQEFEVLIDEVSGSDAKGRLCIDAYEVDNTTTIRRAKRLKAGQIVRAKIVEADAYDFTGELIK